MEEGNLFSPFSEASYLKANRIKIAQEEQGAGMAGSVKAAALVTYFFQIIFHMPFLLPQLTALLNTFWEGGGRQPTMCLLLGPELLLLLC